ncbi:MAG: class II aldolase/adducin family protein [Anaerolineales bacterium]|nr:class II aldolase/adducin family protein [Anaerolineales bacterium]
MKLLEERKKIISISNKLLTDGFINDGQGNLSIYDRLSGLVAITPSAVPYDQRDVEDICVVDLDRNIVEGKWKPTSETPLHLIYYRNRLDVNAVIHSHALNSTVFGIIGDEPMPMILTEAATGLGGAVPIAPYVRPGTDELAEVTFKAIGDGFAAIMANHGLITVGPTIELAYAATAAAEATAETLILVRSMGVKAKSLSDNEVKSLRELFLNYKPANNPDA